MEKIESLIHAVDGLRENVSHDALKEVKNAINEIISPKTTCVNFLYTINTDKLPFGCIVMPRIDGNNINNLIISGDPYRFSEVEVELDSKLFDYGLSGTQIVEIILYNIYHLTNDNTPSIRFREAIDLYFMNHDSQLVLQDSIQYQAILSLGLYDTLVKFTNCMYIQDDIVDDPFLSELDLHNFNNALNILFQRIPGCETMESRRPMLNCLDWCLRLYDDVKKERIPALRLLEKMKSITASTLYIQKFNNAINALNKIDTDVYVNEAVNQYFTEAKKKGSLISQIKYNGLRAIEDDLYEFMVRARNAETEEEVMYALKQINVRLAILDDYLRNEYMSDDDRRRWTSVRDKYIEIRDMIAHKKVYNKKNYGIFVDYNQLDKLDDPDSDDEY